MLRVRNEAPGMPVSNPPSQISARNSTLVHSLSGAAGGYAGGVPGDSGAEPRLIARTFGASSERAEASLLAGEHLRPDIARVVRALLEHDSVDLNVSRYAYIHGMSRWTLWRRLRAQTGLRTKQLVALARMLLAISRLLSCPEDHARLRGDTRSVLSRAERTAIRNLLGLGATTFKRSILSGGRSNVHALLRDHLAHGYLSDSTATRL